MAVNYEELSYIKIAALQYKTIMHLKRQQEWLKAIVIATLLAVIALGIGGYHGFKQFETDIKPQIEKEIEQDIPVPIEQLKEL